MDLVIETLQRERDNGVAVFAEIYEEMQRKAIKTGRTIEQFQPRRCGRQTLRDNVEGSAEEFYRRSVFLTFLDHVLQEMRSRFSKVTETAAKGLYLLPCKVQSLTSEMEDNILKLYRNELPSPHSFSQEIRLWKTLWNSMTESELPATIQATLAHRRVSQRSFPNLFSLLNLLLLMPVTTAAVERANSALKFIKTDRRNRMGEMRLNALLLMFMHKDIKIDLDEVINIFVRKRPRRLLLADPMHR